MVRGKTKKAVKSFKKTSRGLLKDIHFSLLFCLQKNKCVPFELKLV